MFRTHPAKGKRILEPIRSMVVLSPGAWCHHENWDGSGYPRGLVGGNIPLLGRVVLTPKIFDNLERTTHGAGGELQLTDAIQALMEEQAVYGYEFVGTRYDAGTTMGWLKASVELALARPDLGEEFGAYLRGLDF